MITKAMIRKHIKKVMKMVHEKDCENYLEWLKTTQHNILGNCPNNCRCGGKKSNNHFTAAYWIVVQELTTIKPTEKDPIEKTYIKIKIRSAINTAWFMMVQHHPAPQSKQENKIMVILNDIWTKL